MSDTIDIRSVDALFDDAWDEVTKAQKERDALRAENERLRTALQAIIRDSHKTSYVDKVARDALKS